MIDKFYRQFPTRTYLKGEMILQQDVEPTAVNVIRSGAVKVYNIDSSGTERPIGFEVMNELFPIGWIYGHIERTSYFYEAFTDCTVAQIPREDLLHAMKTNHALMAALNESNIIRLIDLQKRIEGLEQARAAHKIAYTLRFLCSRFGSSQKGNKVKIELPLTQQDIANFLGLTRETTAIELKKLEKQGVLDYEHQVYTIHEQQLADLLDEL